MNKIGIAGAGFIGCSWSIVFGRAGHPVTLYDNNEDQRQSALERIGQSLEQLAEAGLIEDGVAILSRIGVTGDLVETVSGAVHIQEAVTERLDAKKEAFRAIDALALPEAVIASSSSTLPLMNNVSLTVCLDPRFCTVNFIRLVYCFIAAFKQ